MVRFLLGASLVFVLVVPARGQITAADADFDRNGVVDFADFLLFVSVFGQTAPIDSPEGDRVALVALYHATDGDNWRSNQGWLSDGPPDSWYGVRVDFRRVIELILSRNQLSGAIPPELGNLARLRILILSSNFYLSSIPLELGNLASLIILDLGNNQLSSIPPELGNLSNLERLDLGNNQLSSIPRELGNLTNLRQLGLRYNQLSSIPRELGNLARLEVLDLGGNQLSGPLPEWMGNLTSLRTLELGGNQGLCMPSSLQNWRFYYTATIPKCSE